MPSFVSTHLHYSDRFGEVSELQISQSRDQIDVTEFGASQRSFVNGIVTTTVRMRISNFALDFDTGVDLDEVFVPSASGPGISLSAVGARLTRYEMDTQTATASVELIGNITIGFVTDASAARLRQRAIAIRKERGLPV